MNQRQKQRRADPLTDRIPAENTAAIYNWAGDSYAVYADGDPNDLFAFSGPHAYADRRVWSCLEAKLQDLRKADTHSLSILDAGCGPGTWLRRLVARAYALGFSRITARGFDIAQIQIRAARRAAHDLAVLPGVELMFDVADLTKPLPEADASVDITICLYSVLNHLPVTSVAEVSGELARVTKGHLLVSVRSIGSTPTIFIDSIEKARRFQLDHHRNRCEVELCDGRRMELAFHLFSAGELQRCFAADFDIEDLRGLDIFHTRFLSDERWNPAFLQTDQQLSDQLAQLEEAYATNPCFIDRATHLLLVGSPVQPVRAGPPPAAEPPRDRFRVA
jgi:SAM-dependent methyltransferase